MNFLLTIEGQSLTLRLDAIIALFGEARTIEIAEGRWSPFVMFEPAHGDTELLESAREIDVTHMTDAELEQELERLPLYVRDFPAFVREAIAQAQRA